MQVDFIEHMWKISKEDIEKFLTLDCVKGTFSKEYKKNAVGDVVFVDIKK